MILILTIVAYRHRFLRRKPTLSEFIETIKNSYFHNNLLTGIARRGLIGFAICYSIFSCNSDQTTKEENKEPASDSLQAANSIAAEDSAIIFNNKADNWINQSLQKTTWNWEGFHLAEFWYEDNLQQQPYKEGPEFYKDYAQLLRWSPDSSYILDIGSHGATSVKDKSGYTHLENGDIDTEITLLYPKTKKKSRVLFFGSTTSVVDARWIDSSQVAIVGISNEKADQHTDTLLFIIDAKQKYFRKYKWK